MQIKSRWLAVIVTKSESKIAESKGRLHCQKKEKKKKTNCAQFEQFN